MRPFLAAAVLVLVAAACGDAGETTTSAAAPAQTTVPQTTTTTTTPPPPTTAPETTTTTTVTGTATTATTSPPSRGAAFTITRVVFGEHGFVEITNFGDSAGDVAGLWLCQRPGYFELPSVELGVGESVWVAAGDASTLQGTGSAAAVIPANGSLGTFAVTGGQVGLFTSNSFTDADAMSAFVEWGAAGGLARFGRADTAEAAGLWTVGDLVAVTPDAIGISATRIPTQGVTDWTAEVGG